MALHKQFKQVRYYTVTSTKAPLLSYKRVFSIKGGGIHLDHYVTYKQLERSRLYRITGGSEEFVKLQKNITAQKENV